MSPTGRRDAQLVSLIGVFVLPGPQGRAHSKRLKRTSYFIQRWARVEQSKIPQLRHRQWAIDIIQHQRIGEACTVLDTLTTSTKSQGIDNWAGEIPDSTPRRSWVDSILLITSSLSPMTPYQEHTCSPPVRAALSSHYVSQAVCLPRNTAL